jgi:hypothetical protein
MKTNGHAPLIYLLNFNELYDIMSRKIELLVRTLIRGPKKEEITWER